MSKRWISITSSANNSHYVQVKVYYVLKVRRYQLSSSSLVNNLSVNFQLSDMINERGYNDYALTVLDKVELVSRYKMDYPEVTEASIPDTVELISQSTPLIDSSLLSTVQDSFDEVEIRFSLVNSDKYWINSDDIAHLGGNDGQLNENIDYWKSFPLSLADLPEASVANTVHYPRTIPISSLKAEYNLAVDENNVQWVYITAANEACSPIKGWVNISKGEQDYLQEHVKRVSPWAWLGFETIEEKASVGELMGLLLANRKIALDLADYTESMTALHHILTNTPLNKKLETDTAEAKKEREPKREEKRRPPFTEQQLKEGLKTPWTAEQIGRLLVKYESEWYADASLSKWNEIDEEISKKHKQERDNDEARLREKNIIEMSINHYLSSLDKQHKEELDSWKIEKEQRIKPSLWWSDVVTAQQAQTDSTTEPVLSKLPADGKVWYLHPVGMREFSIPFGITVEMLKEIFISANNVTLQAIVDDINTNYELYQLNTELRLTHFFAQTLQEVGVSCTTKSENLNYTPEMLVNKFSYFQRNRNESILYGRVTNGTNPHPANQMAIANRAYANRNGNGDISSGDGWKYRGRGMFQLTGKNNYLGFNNWYHENFNNIVDFVENPDLVNTAEYMTVSAAYFWLNNLLHNKADKGSERMHVDSITRVINSGTDSYEARYNNFVDIESKNLFTFTF